MLSNHVKIVLFVAIAVVVLCQVSAGRRRKVHKHATLADTMSYGSTRTYAEAIQFARTHPKRDNGQTWRGYCAALMVRAGNLPDWAVRPSAIIAYHASKIVSKDYNAAPAGAFHWWDITQYGHVAMAIDRRGWALMASSQLQEVWGDGVGIISIEEYNRRTGARYLGWGYDYAGAEIADVHKRSPSPSPSPPSDGSVPKTSTERDGIPGTNFYKRMQLFARRNGYNGPIDGQMGRNSWAGVQRGLRAFGYNGPDDGAPGKNTYIAMQRAAQRYGYSGPIDGAMGVNSYKGFARFLNTL